MPMPRILRGEADEADSRLSKHSRFSASEFETERELVSNAEDVSHHHLYSRNETRCMGEAYQSRTIRTKGYMHNQLPAVEPC